MAQNNANKKLESQSSTWTWLKWTIAILIALYAGYMVVSMYMRGDVAFPLLVIVVVASGVVIFLNKKTYAHRYAFPAIAGMVTFIIFPMLYTLSIAFTNYSGDHTLTVDRAMRYHLDKTYRIPVDQEGGGSYFFKLIVKKSETIKTHKAQIVLMKNDDSRKLYISDFFNIKSKADISKSAEIQTMTVNLNDWNGPQNALHCNDADGQPMSFDDCIKASDYAANVAEPKDINNAYKPYLDKVSLVLPDSNIRLQKTKLKEFEAVINKYDRVKFGATLPGGNFIQAKNLLKDNETGKYFAPDEERGFYRYLDDQGRAYGDDYVPGFKINIGFQNFSTIFNDEGVRGPFFKIFVWTVVFAFLTVLFTLAIGMVLACLVQWEFLKGRGIYRLFLVLPYAVPAFISILVFRGLFNESYGEINGIIKAVAGLFGMSIDDIGWFSSPLLAKSMILIVNTWLGYPYMMILCMGLLKSIPDDLYEASAMDGSSFVNNFFKITLPLLMKPLTPLLIASFAFNFNNFVLIQLLTNGSPDILDANPQAGETDLLVSYTYRIAFQGNGGQNYGLAAAIATLIFILVGAIAILQLWFTRKLAEEKPIA